MTNAPQISVLLPAYNHERYIASAVESLLSQSIDNLEVLAVDDGSTDNTGYILNELAKKDRRLKVFHQENRGVAAALNVALQEASGQWIASCGSDDIVPPNAYRILLRHSSAADVVIGNSVKSLTREDVYGYISLSGLHAFRRFLRCQLCGIN